MQVIVYVVAFVAALFLIASAVAGGGSTVTLATI
jgi:hypothetical protein